MNENNQEHIAAASAAVQNLLLATEARGPAGPGFRYVLAFAGESAPPDYKPIARGTVLLVDRDLSSRALPL